MALILACWCGTVLAQAPQKMAHATYASNGVLIALSDLTPLMDCKVRAIEGKVKDVKEKDGLVTFDLESDEQRLTFQFPLSRPIASAEQVSFRKDFLHKRLKLRASGYACKGEDDPVETISVERVY